MTRVVSLQMEGKMFRGSDENITVTVLSSQSKFNGVHIENVLRVEDRSRHISGELNFDLDGNVIQSRYWGANGIYKDVNLLSWLDCYSAGVRELMSEEDQTKYFPKEFSCEVAGLLGDMHTETNYEKLGEEEYVPDDSWF